MYPDARPFPPSGGGYFFYGFAKKSFCCLCGMICRRALWFGVFVWMVWRIHVIFNLYGWRCVMNQARNEKDNLPASTSF
jgi:hypothetical protein